MNKEFIKVTKKIDKRKKNKNEIIKLSANRKKIDLYCSKLYISFNNLKQPFLSNFNYQTNTINLEKFILEIKKDFNNINNFILYKIFDGNKTEWEESDTEDFILNCFFKEKKDDIIKIGCIIQLYYSLNFQAEFCSRCKTELTDCIKTRIDYLLANKRYCNNIISIEGNDYMKELQDLKDYITDINTERDFLRFADKYLTKKELIIFSLVMSKLFKQNEKFDSKIIKQELNLSDSNYKKLIMNIRNKYDKYKLENK